MAIVSSFTNICLESVLTFAGINPLAFNCLYPTCLTGIQEPCSYWSQNTYQNQLLSRELLGIRLQEAELDIASYLGVYPFPTYSCDEEHDIDKCFRSIGRSLGSPLSQHIFTTDWGCVQEFGQFETVVLGTGDVTLVDEDVDGYKEQATIAFDYSGITIDDFDALELYFQSHDHMHNEICNILYYEVDELNEIVTFTVNSWNLVKPERYLGQGFLVEKTALDACDDDIYVEQVNVCVRRKDDCAPDGYIAFGGGTDCCSSNHCEETLVPFCAIPYNLSKGQFRIQLGAIDEDTGCFVHNTCQTLCKTPTRLLINYLSGCSKCYATSDKHKDFSFCSQLERAIMTLALARMPRFHCECGQCGMSSIVEEWKSDTNVSYRNSDVRFAHPFSDKMNPLGSKLGEISAYRIAERVLMSGELC